MNNEFKVNFLFSLLSTGTGIAVLKLIIDRVASVGIEIHLENNYSRAFREFFNYLFSMIYILIIGGSSYFIFRDKQQSKVDVITRGQYKMPPKMEDENIWIFIAIILLLILLTVILYAAIRGFWYKNYRKRFYMEIDGKKFFIKKRTFKNKVLLFDSMETFKIMDLDQLADFNIKQEGIRERNDTRYRQYYKDFSSLQKWKEQPPKNKSIILIGSIFYVAFLVFLFYIQENKLSIVMSLLIIFGIIFLYYKHQIKKGKELAKDTFYYSVTFYRYYDKN